MPEETTIKKLEKYRPIIEVIERIQKIFPNEGLKFEEQYNCPGFSFKGEWYNLSGYNFLAQIDIISKALQPLLK